ncbi:MAG: hypothetical protein QOE61_621 [Micromonosporaceae bacterium]|jgi:tRNA A-37 threonylcarbamoyl transferase component Bud32|nr:hypothetical protein [Micromonosporaceae bacterium]
MNAQAALLEYGQRLLGEPLTPITWHPGHRGTVVLRASSASHPQIIIKIHRGDVRHIQEVRAYQEWVPQLDGGAPQLVAVGDDPRGIAITTVPGIALADSNLSVTDEQRAHAAAGVLLANLHNAAPSIEDPQFPGWLAERGHHWLNRAGDRITAAERRSAECKLAELAAVPSPRLVPCHLDFTARNLIRDDDGTIRLIDFEHSRYDLPARDLVRLATRVWPQRLDLEAAFLSTYGALTKGERHLIECCESIDHASGLGTDAAMMTR